MKIYLERFDRDSSSKRGLFHKIIFYSQHIEINVSQFILSTLFLSFQFVVLVQMKYLQHHYQLVHIQHQKIFQKKQKNRIQHLFYPNPLKKNLIKKDDHIQ